MSFLAKRKSYVAALVLVVAAIAGEGVGKHHDGDAMMATARASAAPRERPQWHQVASWHLHQSAVWHLIGLGLAVLAVSFWLVSWRRCEPGPHAVLLVLHSVSVLWLLLLV